MSMEHPEKQKNAVKSVVDQVMDGIISQIIDGTLHPGDKMCIRDRYIGVPIVRVDEEMCREAVRKGQRIGVMATLPTTLEPTKGTILRLSLIHICRRCIPNRSDSAPVRAWQGTYSQGRSPVLRPHPCLLYTSRCV